MEVVDDLTVRYRCREPNSAFARRASAWPSAGPSRPPRPPQHGEDLGSHPVGTGPFVFESVGAGQPPGRQEEPGLLAGGPALPRRDRVPADPRRGHPHVQPRDRRHRRAADAPPARASSSCATLDGIDNYEQIGNTTGSNIFNTTSPRSTTCGCAGAGAGVDQSRSSRCRAATASSRRPPRSSARTTPTTPRTSPRTGSSYDPAAAQEELIDEYVDDPERSDGKAPGDPVAFRYDCLPDPGLVEVAQLYQALWSAHRRRRRAAPGRAGHPRRRGHHRRLPGQVLPHRPRPRPAPTLMNAYYVKDSPQNFSRFERPAGHRGHPGAEETTDLAERQELAADVMADRQRGRSRMTYTAGTLSAVARPGPREEHRRLDVPRRVRGRHRHHQGTFVWDRTSGRPASQARRCASCSADCCRRVATLLIVSFLT